MSDIDGSSSSRVRDRLYAEALGLPADQRAELACSLLESIDSGDEATAGDGGSWADAWAAEVTQRLADMDAGRSAVPAADAISRLKRGV